MIKGKIQPSNIGMFDPISVRHDEKHINGKVIGLSMDRRCAVAAYFTDDMDTEKEPHRTKVLDVDNITVTLHGYYEK
jgi:hypothetical protein